MTIYIKEEYPYETTVRTSNQIPKNYYNNIKEFLSQIIQMTGAEKVKKFSRKMKIYAQVLGLQTNKKDK